MVHRTAKPFFKPSQPCAELRLGHRSLYIIPSRFGALWIAAAGLLLLVAIQTGSNSTLLLAFLLRPHRIAALRDIWAREPHLLACLHTEERLARAGSGGAQVQVIRAVPEEADRVRAAEAAKLLL